MPLVSPVLQIDLPVSCKIGLHAKPAAMLVKTAIAFDASITLQCSHRMANAKSMLSVLTLGAAKGAVVTVTAEGADARDAILAVRDLFVRRFDEEAEGVSDRTRKPGCTGGSGRQRHLSQDATMLAAASL